MQLNVEMILRIQKFQAKFDDDGVIDFEIPATPENSVNHNVRFERLNDRALEIYVSDVLWTEEDDQNFLLNAMEVAEIEDGDVD